MSTIQPPSSSTPGNPACLDCGRPMSVHTEYGPPCPSSAPEQVERGHALDRISYLAGYIAACGQRKSGITPDNDSAVMLFAERSWKATGADRDALLDAVSGPSEEDLFGVNVDSSLAGALTEVLGRFDHEDWCGGADGSCTCGHEDTRATLWALIERSRRAPSTPPESDERQVVGFKIKDADGEPLVYWCADCLAPKDRLSAGVAAVPRSEAADTVCDVCRKPLERCLDCSKERPDMAAEQRRSESAAATSEER